MPLGRSGIGRWLVLGLDKSPEANPAAGAKVSATDKDGNPVKWVDDQGNDVSDDAKKFGTGVVKQPSFWSKAMGSPSAQRALELNTEYNARPGVEKQEYGIQKDQAKDVIRSAIALRDDKKPSEIGDDEVEKIYGATGTSAKGGGISPAALNLIHRSITEGKLGVPEVQGQTTAEEAKSGLESARAFNTAGGGPASGQARAVIARVGGKQAESTERTLADEEAARKAELGYAKLKAESGIKLTPGETDIEYQRQLGTRRRMGMEQQILDEDQINHLAQVHNVDPELVKKAAIDAKAATGRAVSENEVHAHLLNAELSKAGAMDDSRDMLAQTVRNQARQGLAESAMPPTGVLASPTLYSPNPNFKAGDSIAKMYKRQPGLNPMFQPGIMAKVFGAQKLGEMIGGSGGGGVALPGGGMVDPNEFGSGAPAASDAATSAVRTPTVAPTVARPSMAGRTFFGTNNAPAISMDESADVGGVTPNSNPRLQYLLGKKRTYTLTPAEEKELAGFPGQ